MGSEGSKTVSDIDIFTKEAPILETLAPPPPLISKIGWFAVSPMSYCHVMIQL